MKSINNNNYGILMPPPNVTGELHMGHALTFWIQDLIIKNQQILGKKSYLIPGCDHGGIATYKTARKLLNKELVTYDEIYQIGQNHLEDIRKQWEKMGLSIKWDYFQYTMNDDHIKLVQDSFIRLYNDGLAYREKKIIAYDTSFKTAISDLEIEYQDRDGKIYDITYKISDSDQTITVSTTRPETIFADTAIAVNPDDQRYQNFIGKKAIIPLENREIPIISDHRVKIQFGTGALKITPAHALVDWDIGLDHKLEVVNMIDKEGLSIHKNSQYNGKNMVELRKIVSESLSLPYKIIKQNLPFSSRSGTMVEYLLETQWFINMKQLAQEAINKYPNFIPEYYYKTYYNWLSNIKPWCISRTIPWGQKMPVYYNNEAVYVGYKPPEGFTASHEVFDTWFSSALWPILYDNLFDIKVDLLVTGYDIIFFWVARMIMMNLYFKKYLPFKDVFIHGLICDKQGRKMSKTLGNGLNPIELIDQYGLSVIKLSVFLAYSDGNKIKFSTNNINNSKKIINKLKNFNKYMDQYNSNKPESPVHQTMINKFNNYLHQYKILIEKHDIQKQVKLAQEILFWTCDWIIEISKKYTIDHQYFQKQINNLFYPLTSESKEYTSDTIPNIVNHQDSKSMDILEHNIKIIRSLQSNVPVCYAIGERSDIINHLTKGKSIKSDYYIKLLDIVVYFKEDISIYVERLINKYQKELDYLENIPGDISNNKKEKIKILIESFKKCVN